MPFPTTRQSDIQSFLAASGTFVDTTQAEFGQGTPDANLTLTAEEDGEVRLANTPGSAEFGGTRSPDRLDERRLAERRHRRACRVEPWSSTGLAPTPSPATPPAPRSSSSRPSAPPGSRTWGSASGSVVFDGPPAAMFSTGGDGTQVFARVWTAAGGFVDTPLGATLVSTPHTYRLVWKTDAVEFWVDGVLRHTDPTAIGGSMSVAVSDYEAGVPAVSVDWMHVTKYVTPGTFVSRVFDAGASTSTWGALSWTADDPAGTALAMSVRTGNTSPPAGAWVPIASSGTTIGVTGQYLQYQAVLSTTNTVLTPVLRRVEIGYNTVPDNEPPTIQSRTPAPGATGVAADSPVVVQFSETMDAGTITTATFRVRVTGSPSDVAAIVSTVGATATLTPSSPLTLGTGYTVTVAGTVADLAGNDLGSPDTWTFTTVPPDMTPPVISNVTALPGLGGTTATVQWLTDEPATSVVGTGPTRCSRGRRPSRIRPCSPRTAWR